MRTPHRFTAAMLSFLLPGLGQLYAGDRSKGWAIVCMTLGIAAGIGWSIAGPEAFRSVFAPFLLGFVYLFVWFPSAIDAYQVASGRATSLLSGHRPWYVIFMLATVGPMAIPLLWQSTAFSKTVKIILTTIVLLILVLSVALVVVIGPFLERFLATLAQGL